MSQTDKIKLAINRSSKALSLKPALGKGTAISKTRITNGLTCEIEEGNWRFTADMPPSIGGNGSAPRPGVYGRAALGSCLAIGYMMKAAGMSIPITSLAVEVETDYDDGGLLGTADIDPGYMEVRYKVIVESEASEEDLLRMLDDADEHSPYLDVFSRSQVMKREIHIITPQLQP
ncbi:MAG TPA: OsmC family protein [Puia sp.]|nr:OsmC family protein [Puia sp.]